MNEGSEFSVKIESELKLMIREKIAPFATPDYIQSAPGLPKTRSGKIMRRVLKKIANDERDLGDISTMADSSVVEVSYSTYLVVVFIVCFSIGFVQQERRDDGEQGQEIETIEYNPGTILGMQNIILPQPSAKYLLASSSVASIEHLNVIQ